MAELTVSELAKVVDAPVDRLLRQMRAAGLPHEPGLRYSINLSAKALDNPRILDTITRSLSRHGVPAAHLMFEVTETIAVSDLAVAVEFLEALKRMGCETALDDFGAGYCSFAYLKDLPADRVKIDGNFVRDIADNELNCAMVKAMIDIAHATRRKTVAEFVEDAECLEILRQLGVDQVQGYHLGRPEPLPDYPAVA